MCLAKTQTADLFDFLYPHGINDNYSVLYFLSAALTAFVELTQEAAPTGVSTVQKNEPRSVKLHLLRCSLFHALTAFEGLFCFHSLQ